MKNVWIKSALATSVWLLASCTASSENDQSRQIHESHQQASLGQGEVMAENLCAPCHAVSLTDRSKHPEAIPLRQLSWGYPVQSLEESFSEGIMVGHPDMPEWKFKPQDVEALLAYIESIQVPEKR